MSEINFDSIHVEDTVWSFDLHVFRRFRLISLGVGIPARNLLGYKFFNLGFIILRVALQDTMW